VEEPDRTKPEAYLGIKLNTEERATITNVIPGSPAFKAGLDRNDQLLAINDVQTNAANLNEVLLSLKPGEVVKVTIFRARRLRSFDVTIAGRGNIVYRLKRLESLPDVAQRVLTGWLNNEK
jgi:predicted metalloprotease with PDZ domain